MGDLRSSLAGGIQREGRSRDADVGGGAGHLVIWWARGRMGRGPSSTGWYRGH